MKIFEDFFLAFFYEDNLFWSKYSTESFVKYGARFNLSFEDFIILIFKSLSYLSLDLLLNYLYRF